LRTILGIASGLLRDFGEFLDKPLTEGGRMLRQDAQVGQSKRTAQMPKKNEPEEKVRLDFWTAMKASVLKEPKQTLADYIRFHHIRFLVDRAHDERNEEKRKKSLADSAAQRFRGG
jgi:hypothetical protein